MKYNPILRSKRLNSAGFTLIEISLVIALLLGLIAVVFLGLGSYREGSNRATCRMQLASVQKAVRSYANMQNLLPGATVNASLLNDGTIMSATPICPTGTAYLWTGNVPIVGVSYGTCTYTTPTINHTLTGIQDW